MLTSLVKRFGFADKEKNRILLAIANGQLLKSQRDVDGQKFFILYALDGNPQLIDSGIINRLRAEGLIDSNKKFPVATFWLTQRGKQLVLELSRNHPLV